MRALRSVARPLLVVGACAVALLVPLLVFGEYWQHLAVLAAIYVMLASSLNLLIGYSGLVSLGHTAFFGIGAYATGIATTHWSWPLFGGIGFALVTALVGGYLIAIVALRLRGASFVIATLAVAEGLRLLAINWEGVTGGPAGLLGIPPLSIAGHTFIDPDAVYPVVFGVAVVCVLLIARLVHSSLGEGLVAMRDHELLAQALGIDPVAHARKAFVVGGVIASLAGALYAHYIGFISPEVFSFTLMVTILLMVVAGGLGTIAGPVIGATLFTALPEALRFSDQWRLVLYGGILLLIVRFAPRGIWGVFRSLARAILPASQSAEAGVPSPANGASALELILAGKRGGS